MFRIYRAASEVVIFLGEGNDANDRAMDIYIMNRTWVVTKMLLFLPGMVEANCEPVARRMMN